jgi:flagellar motor switch protein FliN/FliY
VTEPLQPYDGPAGSPLDGAPSGATTLVEPAVLTELGEGAPPQATRDLGLLNDIVVEVSIELGRLKLPLRDLLSVTPGAVFELDRAADAPVDILVNGRLVARGEVVVIDGELGVRVLDVLPTHGAGV